MIESITTESKYYDEMYWQAVGDRLREARDVCRRNEERLTQPAACEELGKLTGIALESQSLSNIEHGRGGRLKVDLILGLCQVYGASPLWVLLERGPMHWEDLISRLETPEFQTLQAVVDRASPAVREKFVDYLSARDRTLVKED